MKRFDKEGTKILRLRQAKSLAVLETKAEIEIELNFIRHNSLLIAARQIFERAGGWLWWLTLVLFPIPFRLSLVEGRVGPFPSSITGLDFYLSDALLCASMLYWLVSFQFSVFKRQSSAPFSLQLSIRNLQLIALLGLLVWGGLSILWAQDQAAAAFFWLRLAEGVGLVGLTWFYTRKYSPVWAAFALALGGAGEGLLALDQLFEGRVVSLINWPKTYRAGGPDASVIEIGPGHYLLRAYGTFSHPNLLGGFCMIALLASLWLIWRRRGLARGLAIGLIGPIIAGLGLSFSRSAWLGLLVAGLGSLILWLGQARPLPAPRYPSKRAAKRAFTEQVLSNQPKKLTRWLVLPPLLLALLAGLFLPGVQNRLFALDSPLEQRSIDERVGYAENALQLISTAPFWGVGLNNFTVVQVKQQPRIEAVWPVHNVPLLLTAELGPGGLLLWLLIPLALALEGWRGFKRRELWSIWTVAGLALLVISQFDHYIWTLQPGQSLFFGIMGLWLAVRTEQISKRPVEATF